MLRRRITDTLKQWKEKPGHMPLVIMGIRQCGKTFISRQFAKENYKHVVYINFIKQEERKTAFYGSKDAETIIFDYLQDNLAGELGIGRSTLYRLLIKLEHKVRSNGGTRHVEWTVLED